MAAKLTDLWEKKASSPIEGIAKKSDEGGTAASSPTTSSDVNKLAKRRTCVYIYIHIYIILTVYRMEIEKAISADRKAKADLAKATSFHRRNTTGDNKENSEPARKISFAGNTKDGYGGGGVGGVGVGNETKKEIQKQIGEVRKMLKNSLAVVNDLAARVDEM